MSQTLKENFGTVFGTSSFRKSIVFLPNHRAVLQSKVECNKTGDRLLDTCHSNTKYRHHRDKLHTNPRRIRLLPHCWAQFRHCLASPVFGCWDSV
jgi:hypothetical protein